MPVYITLIVPDDEKGPPFKPTPVSTSVTVPRLFVKGNLLTAAFFTTSGSVLRSLIKIKSSVAIVAPPISTAPVIILSSAPVELSVYLIATEGAVAVDESTTIPVPAVTESTWP